MVCDDAESTAQDKKKLPKRQSFSARFRRKFKPLAPIEETDESLDSFSVSASLILYFGDVMCLSKPKFLVVPDDYLTANMRLALQAAHDCDWSLFGESSDRNWDLKSQALYLLDASNPFVRAWKKERLAFSAALVDKHGNRLMPGHLAQSFSAGTFSSAKGHTITHWYIIKRPF